MTTSEKAVDLSEIERKLQDINIFSGRMFDPFNYIDDLLSEQCDISLEQGIEAFSMEPLFSILSIAEKKLQSQFSLYVSSVNSLQEECVEEEESYLGVIKTAKDRMKKAIEEFEGTENGLNQLSEEVMQSGERLLDLREEVTKDKEVLEMLRMFDKMSKDEEFNVKNYDVEYPDIEFVIRVQKLKQLCRELTNENVIWGVQHVGDYYNHLNEELTKKFNKGFDEKNYLEMKDNAELLYYLNRGNNSINYYIENNEFLLNENEVNVDEKLASEKEEISNKELLLHNQRLEMFYKKMINQSQKEKREIDKIFIQKEIVNEKFIQEMFEFRIQNFLDIYLHESSQSTMEYLFKLYDAVDQTITLLSKSIVGSKIVSMKFMNEMIDDCFKQDIDEYYQINEKAYINELFDTNKSNYMKLKKELKVDSPSKTKVDELNKLIDISTIQFILQQFSFAISRSKVLCPTQDLVSFIYSLFESLMNWVDSVLNDSIKKMIYLTQKYSTDPLKSVNFFNGYLEVIKQNCDAINLIKNILEKEILPNFKFSYQKYNECITKFNTKYKEMEQNITESLENSNDWITKVIEKKLKYKAEFVFKDENDMTWTHSPACTLVCKEFCEYLKEYLNSIDKYITGKNHKNFVISFGRNLYNTLIETFMKLKITPFSGGFIFMYDIRYLTDLIRSSSFPLSIKSMFENLTMLFKIYCIDKTNVISITNTIIEDGGFEFIDPNEMLKCRTDYSKEMVVDYAQEVKN
ncbi:exocyst complex component sec10, putative [Entamoeba histolytica HM-1:IMSS-B]|uniref:Exocyst complex component Sec10-like alpha-helical bundle domain-containing protein n=6 Tax=Entamoeba histolytica TaxID=5759 RepID=C4M2L5_ENTH1|nr:hypothetical protein EHI_079940 [Entamoeba histolytica HM-1:IMSS]EMD48745.1 exocyst complex component, putative [Entamoeba histolytica KU27]EMH75209.1 exocyst complex component sec10, putative [Entamoeba histolytica HM-1:IMSS-B]EMS12603.1 exocyst complex component, putative [Entamoeba histolytica HM-3:IMSS]ENY62463.1 exocyst complex component, putative [Entamoeba histolytica HM-1:IMSS-A]GAT95520.1 hypothetical protein CL6EHI_079940 [Entamoeba histolytica]|eukprot:XP_652877.1 hypothetical protein EHI_079940 [Entamoeba histolytica HM-1:IMSS]